MRETKRVGEGLTLPQEQSNIGLCFRDKNSVEISTNFFWDSQRDTRTVCKSFKFLKIGGLNTIVLVWLLSCLGARFLPEERKKTHIFFGELFFPRTI